MPTALQQLQMLTTLKKLKEPTVSPGGIDQKSEPQKDILKQLSFLKSIKDNLENIQKVRAEPGERFILGAGNEPGPMMTDIAPYQKASEEEPTPQGFFDKLMTNYVAAPKGLAQRTRLMGSINALSPTAFALGGKTLPPAERMTALAEFQPDPNMGGEQFDTFTKNALENQLPLHIGTETEKLRGLGVSEDAVNRYLQTVGLFNK